MRTLRHLALGLTALAPIALAQDEGGVPNPFDPFDQAAYEAHAKTLGADDAAIASFRTEVEELGVARAADNLMRSLFSGFDAAVNLSQQGDPKAALALTKVLAGTSDPVLQGHTRYHLARVFLDGDDPERAVEILDEFLKNNSNRTPLDDEVVYFYAQALAEVPVAEEAAKIFRAYLQWFPDAPERYRATAAQRMAELEAQLDSDLHMLADGMKKVTRDIKKQKTGDPTQEKQKGFLTKLDELIEMYEELEKQSSGGPSGNQIPSGPAANSALPDGEARIGNLENVRGVADRWGDMKDKDRQAIETDLQSSLPPQYQKMLEEYYKRLGTGGGR